ncbi:HAD-IA family hydrolase [Kitasatospora sp. NPDC050543]|uniref:HAD-IA family hydrolase n=1 Tax=Kitasatospora sp. NPDC050543 TaxID=3364054 RepID=UPI0037AA6866
MPLLLFDLDNTLLPRDAAFRAWAQDFLAERRLPAGEVDWLTTIDGGGYVPRSTVLSAVRRRYGLDHSLDFLLAHYRRGINSHIHCPTGHVEALQAARAAGWTLGIVSNGGTRPQLEKIRRTGLAPLVDGWVISEEARCLKPDPLIFEIAAQRCGVAPTGDWAAHTWMIGDHAPADIAGAELTGLRSVWLHHGRPWSEPGYRPTLSTRGLPEAVGLVLSAVNARSPRPAARPGVRPDARPAPRAAAQTAARAGVPMVSPVGGGVRSQADGPSDTRAAEVGALSGARAGAQMATSAPGSSYAPAGPQLASAAVAAHTQEPPVRNLPGTAGTAGSTAGTTAAGASQPRPRSAGPASAVGSRTTVDLVSSGRGVPTPAALSGLPKAAPGRRPGSAGYLASGAAG